MKGSDIFMATWLAHLRIADYFINNIDWLNASEFTVGSVAPDCGYGEKDSFGDFIPPPSITHWTETGRKVDCRYKDFYETYLNGGIKDSDYSFYLGYYIHLLTDIMWSSRIYMPTRIKYKEQYEENPEFLKIIKVDWYDLDHKFLRDNPNFKPFRLLEEKTQVKDYLPYYEKDQLTIQTRFIVDFYNSNKGKTGLDREHLYLTETAMNNFISCACELIELDLVRRGIINMEEKMGFSA